MIEECLHEHPDVQLAAAVGRPDAYAGEIPVAYVELKADAKVTSEELRQFAEERIFERPALPAEVILIDHMPVTAVGKIFKPDLRYDIIERTYRPLLTEIAGDCISFDISVGAEGSHGILASVTVTVDAENKKPALSEKIQDILGPYPVNYRLFFKVAELAGT
ncbi:MAG: hypothetical protein JJ879_06580 [Sneathiella sp.]|nr:hypothetical protein [Sneathiella sp.]